MANEQPKPSSIAPALIAATTAVLQIIVTAYLFSTDRHAKLREQRVSSYAAFVEFGVLDEALVSNSIQKDWATVHTKITAAVERIVVLGPTDVSQAALEFQKHLQPPFERDAYYKAKEAYVAASRKSLSQ